MIQLLSARSSHSICRLKIKEWEFINPCKHSSRKNRSGYIFRYSGQHSTENYQRQRGALYDRRVNTQLCVPDTTELQAT